MGVWCRAWWNPKTGVVLLAPNLGWSNIQLRDPIAARWACRSRSKNSGKACALAQIWAVGAPRYQGTSCTSACRMASVGIVMGGGGGAGHHNIAGRVRTRPLECRRHRLGCGRTGSGRLTSRTWPPSPYFGVTWRKGPGLLRHRSLTVDDLIARARGGDGRALAALLETGRYLGLGLGSVVNAIDPFAGLHRRRNHESVGPHRSHSCARARRARADASLGATPITIVPPEQYPRLRGPLRSSPLRSFAKDWWHGR